MTPPRQIDPALKAHHDQEDPSTTICRCPGAPEPLAATGRHCVKCRRLFSAGVRLMLVEEAAPRPRGRWARLRALLYANLRFTPWPTLTPQ